MRVKNDDEIGHEMYAVAIGEPTEFPPQVRGQMRRCSKSPAAITAKKSSRQKS
jgi:hypothetical protein